LGTDLNRIWKKARKEPGLVFTTLYHHVTDVDNLRACYGALGAGKATGVDGVSKAEYGKELAQNLEDLSGRLKDMKYRPQPKRRTYVPKPGSEKGRPLGISNFEDKLVELAVKRVLEPIYEQAFVDNSYGYRPNRSPHRCLDDLGRTIQQEFKSFYFRFADDFLACFQYKSDAVAFQEQLEGRSRKSGLELALEKTRCIKFGRFAREDARKKGEKPEEFTFLGFTHYCGKTRKGAFKLKRRTSRKKFGLSLRKFTEWAQQVRSRLSNGQMLRQAKVRVAGHLSYYAITDNTEKCSSFVYFATGILFKWINRRSQRRSYTWEGFHQVLDLIGWPKPTIRRNLNPFRRETAFPNG
jgi:hypothetical protein